MTRNSRELPATYLLDWLVPALFALLVSATIRFHSLAPIPTMPRMVGNLLALDAVALLGLLALGRRVRLAGEATLLLVLAASATISVVASGHADISLLRLELYVAIALLAMVFYVLYRDAERLPLEGYFLAVSVVFIPFLIPAVLWIRDSTPPFWQFTVRVGDFAHVRQFGEFAFFAAASATALGAISARMAIPSVLLAAAALFGLVLTGCRGALLAWLVLVILLCGFGPHRLRMTVLGIGSLVPAGLLVWYLDRWGILQSPNIFSRMVQLVQSQGSGFDSGRIDIWMASLREIAAHPFFGNGPEGFWISGCCSPNFMQAHNFVLQFLMEFGVIGCGVALWLVVRVLRRLGGMAGLRSLVAANHGSRVLASMLAAYVFYSLIDQTMYHLLPLLLFAPVAGLFAASIAQSRRGAIPTA